MVNGNRPLAVIAGIAIVFLLNYAAEFFIPLFLAILISYALTSPVTWLQKVVRWRSVAAGKENGSRHPRLFQ